jgi:hypothetical protein
MHPPFICIIEGDNIIFAEDNDILNQQLVLGAKDQSTSDRTLIAPFI